MIIKVIRKMIPFVHNKFMNNFYCSTVSNTKIQDEELLGLKAIWAESIFNHLSKKYYDYKQPLVDYLSKYKLEQSITDQLLNKNHKWQYTQTDIENVRKQIMAAFDPFQGVQIPTQIVATQQRLAKAINEKTNKITFYPNTITTQIIFDRLRVRGQGQSLQSRDITIGKPGISKTMNYILAWHLSSISTKFRYLNPQLTQQFVNAKIMKQYGLKIFYVSFFQQLNESKFIDLILSQCPQILQDKKIKQQINLIKKQNKVQLIVQRIIKQYKNKKINLLGVVDQLNALARQFKIQNEKKQKQKQKKKKKKEQQNKNKEQQQQISKIEKQLQMVKKQLQQIEQKKIKSTKDIQEKQTLIIKQKQFRTKINIKRIQMIKQAQFQQAKAQLLAKQIISQIKHQTLTNNYYEMFNILKFNIPLIFNSSANIQKTLYRSRNQQIGLYYTLDINSHSPPNPIYCEYKQNEIAAKQIYRFFWYQFIKRVQCGIETDKLKSFQQNKSIFIKCCDDLAAYYKLGNFITPNSIRQAIQSQINKQQIKLNLEDSVDIYNKFADLLKKIIINNLLQGSELYQKFKNWLFDKNKHDMQIKYSILFNTWFYIKRNPQAETIPFKQIFPSQQKIIQLCNKDIFYCDKQGNLTLRVRSEQFKKINVKLIDEIISKPQYLKDLYNIKLPSTGIGCFIQTIFLRFVQSCHFLQLKSQKKRFYFKCVGSFLSFNSIYTNHFQNIQQMLQSSKMHLTQISLGYPITKDEKQSSNNPKFDFLGVQYIQEQNKFQIMSFDFTVQQSISKKRKKAEGIIKYFQRQSQTLLINKSMEYLNLKMEPKTYFTQILSIIPLISEEIKKNDSQSKPETKNQNQTKAKAKTKTKTKKETQNTNKNKKLQKTISQIIKTQSKLGTNDQKQRKQVKEILQKYGYLGVNKQYQKMVKSWTHYIICLQKQKLNKPQILRSENPLIKIETLSIEHLSVQMMDQKAGILIQKQSLKSFWNVALKMAKKYQNDETFK